MTKIPMYESPLTNKQAIKTIKSAQIAYIPSIITDIENDNNKKEDSIFYSWQVWEELVKRTNEESAFLGVCKAFSYKFNTLWPVEAAEIINKNPKSGGHDLLRFLFVERSYKISKVLIYAIDLDDKLNPDFAKMLIDVYNEMPEDTKDEIADEQIARISELSEREEPKKKETPPPKDKDTEDTTKKKDTKEPKKSDDNTNWVDNYTDKVDNFFKKGWKFTKTTGKVLGFAAAIFLVGQCGAKSCANRQADKKKEKARTEEVRKQDDERQKEFEAIHERLKNLKPKEIINETDKIPQEKLEAYLDWLEKQQGRN